MLPTYKLHHRNQLPILKVDNLLTEYGNRALLEVVQQKIDAGFTTFVIDLQDMAYTNSIGLNFLIAVQARCQDKGGNMAIANISSKVRQLLHITKLDTIFSCCPSVDDAIRRLQSNT